MQATYSPRSSKEQGDLLSARSSQMQGFNEQVEQDLELLIRAHERIRQLQEENAFLKEDMHKLNHDAQFHQRTVQSLVNENSNLTQINSELLTRILQLQKRVPSSENKTYHLTTAENQQNTWRKQNSGTVLEQNSVAQIEKEQLSGQTKTQKSLKQCESTPLILNINLNPFSKHERQSFISTCKQDFAQELSKIKHSDTACSKFPFNLTQNPKHYTEYYSVSTSIKNTTHPVKNNFIKQAEQQFINQNSKTLKNIHVDRKKSTSSTSVSLIRKNFIGQRYDTDSNPKLFRDQTNVWNSKYASIDQIISGTKSQYGNSQSGVKIFPQSNDSGVNIEKRFRQSVIEKSKNKSIYFKSDNSKSVYVGKEKDLMKGRRKEVQLELKSQQTGGVIKYRGLCL